MIRIPYTLCIDVGAPRNIGWADSEGRLGTGSDLETVLSEMAERLSDNQSVALGFEAPIWTPTRHVLGTITGNRGGIEKDINRAWSASAGTCALGAALALMPWCFANVARKSAAVSATVDLNKFHKVGGLFIWEAFVSGKMKGNTPSHNNDAKLACEAFLSRWPMLKSDIPAQQAMNHAVSSAMSVGLSIDKNELTMSSLVIGAKMQQ